MQTLKSFVRHQVIPRVVYIPFVASWLMQFLVSAFSSRGPGGAVCIEAGVKGWESIEFKELYQSAAEYLGGENVSKLVISADRPYLEQVKSALETGGITHYLYDPRTGAQEWWKGVWQSFRIAFMLARRGIVPIVLLTDQAVRLWRTQSSIVSAYRGVIVTFISAREVRGINPHGRIIGPSLMPFSMATLTMLKARGTGANRKGALFMGSLYEPRKTMLQQIAKEVGTRGHTLDIKGRELGSARKSDDEYWDTLINAEVVITTADQLSSEQTDWTWIQHMVYRYLEVTACGSMLLAPDVPGVRRYFQPGVHFIPFVTVEDAVDALVHFLESPEERARIADAGQERAIALVSAHTFWTGIDAALGPDAIL